MGQSYCTQGCCHRENQQFTAEFYKQEADQPQASFAKIVRQYIQLHPKVKQTYVIYRTPHEGEKKGVKLALYYLFKYSAYYEGEWKNGVPHGFGRLIYDDGSVYQGCFKEGVAECKQALFIKDQNIFFRGSIKNNKANGYGELSTPKLFYKGYWVNDLPQGKARQIYSAISFYQGQFCDGMKKGDGIYYWNQYEYYFGEFSRNIIEGFGDLTTKQYHYKGEFKNGRKQGFGTYTDFINKFIYEGTFVKNNPRGQGIITYSDNTVFKGIFSGFQHKNGILTLSNGQSLTINTLQNSQESSESDKLYINR